MIQIVPLEETPAEYFESFDELFKDIITTESSKLRDNQPGDDQSGDVQPNLAQMHWSFTIYPPKRVAALYAHTTEPCEAMQEALEDNLPLIEICAGDYTKPLYITLSPNVDLDYLKRKWCIDWCTFHHVLVREMRQREKYFCSLVCTYNLYNIKLVNSLECFQGSRNLILALLFVGF